MDTPATVEKRLFFFRVFRDGVERHRTEGIEFSSMDEVWEEASTASGEILREMDGKMHVGMDWRMDVSDDDGKLIYRLSFKTEQL
jgi:hypothetical protein